MKNNSIENFLYLSEHHAILKSKHELNSYMILVAAENLSWTLVSQHESQFIFQVNPSLLSDGEIVTIRYNGQEWEIFSRTELPVMTSFVKNWQNVKKFQTEISLMDEYEKPVNQSIETINLQKASLKHWIKKIPWLSIIIILIHLIVFYKFNKEVRDDAWQAESKLLKEQGAFNREYFYTNDYYHIIKSFFFDFRPGILYVFIFFMLCMGYVLENAMNRLALMGIIIVSNVTGLFWAFDRNLGLIYDTSQATVATMIGVYLVGLATRKIYFPFQRMVSVSIIIYLSYWYFKSDYFPVIDKHVFLGSILFGIIGGASYFLPLLLKGRKRIQTWIVMSLFFLGCSYMVYANINHDRLSTENFKEISKTYQINIYSSVPDFEGPIFEKNKKYMIKSLHMVRDQVQYKNSAPMILLNTSCLELLEYMNQYYEFLQKQTKLNVDQDKFNQMNSEIRKLYLKYKDNVELFYNKEHIKIYYISLEYIEPEDEYPMMLSY